MTNFILRLDEPHVQKNGELCKLIGNATLKTFADLIADSDLSANPRNAKVNRVTKEIEDTLRECPELLPCMSKGILFATQTAQKLERDRYKLEVQNSEIEGILDGGHNALAIGRFILEHREYDDWRSATDWAELKQHWKLCKERIDAGEIPREFPQSIANILIPVEVIYPESASQVDTFVDSVLQISAARNNNVQLRDTAKANKKGLYDELKESIDSNITDDVQWREGETSKRIKVEDVIAMSLVPLSALPGEKYDKETSFVKSNPNILYSSKQKCVSTFNRFMDIEGVTTSEVGNTKVKIVDPLVKSALALISDMPRLYDLIYRKFPNAYNEASPGFGRIRGVRTRNPARWKDDKKAFMKKPEKTKFYQEELDYSYPDGFIYPLVANLSTLIEVSGNKVSWRTDPDDFIDKHLSTILKNGYQTFIKGQDYNPQRVGKEKGSYNLVRSLYQVAEHL